MKQSNDNSEFLKQVALLAFRSDAHLGINKALIKAIGLVPAGIFGFYLECYSYFLKKDKLIDDNWFYVTHEYIAENLNIAVYTVRKNKMFLQNELHIIETRMGGLPAKEYIKINFDNLYGSLGLSLNNTENESNTDPKFSGGLDPKFSGGHNKTIYNNNNFVVASDKNLFLDNKITPKQFEDFWKIYPKRTDQGKALTSWNKLCKKKERPNFDTIRKAILSQKKSERWQDKQFIPLPTTWLNQSRWFDSAEEMTVFKRTLDKDTARPPKNYDGINYNYDPEDGLYKNRGGEVWRY